MAPRVCGASMPKMTIPSKWLVATNKEVSRWCTTNEQVGLAAEEEARSVVRISRQRLDSLVNDYNEKEKERTRRASISGPAVILTATPAAVPKTAAIS